MGGHQIVDECGHGREPLLGIGVTTRLKLPIYQHSQPPHLIDEREQRPAIRLGSIRAGQLLDLVELGVGERLRCDSPHSPKPLGGSPGCGK